MDENDKREKDGKRVGKWISGRTSVRMEGEGDTEKESEMKWSKIDHNIGIL